MLGMGVGSIVGGAFADRLERQSQLILVFALSELVIGAFGAISKFLFHDFLCLSIPHFGDSKATAFLLLFFTLLIPTFFMGLTLPFLSKAVITRIERAVEKIALLYALNTLGASVGSVIAATVLIRHLGYEYSILVAAAVNFFCAVAALLLGWVTRREPGIPADNPTPTTTTTRSTANGADQICSNPLNRKCWLLKRFFRFFCAWFGDSLVPFAQDHAQSQLHDLWLAALHLSVRSGARHDNRICPGEKKQERG